MPTESLSVPERKIQIIIVEDDMQVLDRMKQAIATAPDMVLQAAVSTRAKGLALIKGEPSDVLLVDLGLPDGSGIDVIREANVHWLDCNVMVSTTFGDEAHVMESLQAGAAGYLLKDSSPKNLVAEIRSLHEGGSPISPLIARQILNRFTAPVTVEPHAVTGKHMSLSPREKEALVLITKGFTAEEIAKLLGVSRHTVLTFIRRIYNKLEVKSKSEAIYEARQRGLIRD